MARPQRLLALALAAPLLLSACSGGDDGAAAAMASGSSRLNRRRMSATVTYGRDVMKRRRLEVLGRLLALIAGGFPWLPGSLPPSRSPRRNRADPRGEAP